MDARNIGWDLAPARTLVRAALTSAVALAVGLSAVPTRAQHDGRQPSLAGVDDCTATACHFDLPPGHYDVEVTLGGRKPSSTAVVGESRRALLPETAAPAGRRIVRAFTVNVRTPEGEPLGAPGTPGLDLALRGAAPALADIQVAPARRARQILLVGDSTVSDQPAGPYSGWGQRLPQYLRGGLSVANYADTGESTVSYLGNPLLWDTVAPRIRRGDLVLVQLAHNDRTTGGAAYRANLEALVAGVLERGGEPVLVTPVVRRAFGADGTLDNGTALLVNGLGVDRPAVVRSVAADRKVPLIDLTARTKALVESLGAEGSGALYVHGGKRDDTHTSVRGATVFAGLVRDELVDRRLVPENHVRVR